MDPIANMLTAIYNASQVGKTNVIIPYSTIKDDLAKAMSKHGYIGRVVKEEADNRSVLNVELKYHANNQPLITKIKRVSKPGLRIYAKAKNMPRPRGGVGIVVVSTPKGIMSGYEAQQKNLGGEVLCEVIS